MSSALQADDNRRLVVRVFSQQILQFLADTARAYDEDLIAVLVFTAVWTANTAHLAPTPALRYTKPRDIPPDSLRTPVREEELPDRLRMPRAIVSVYVRDLIAKGMLERTEAGLVVPTAVIARPQSLQTLSATYERIVAMTQALHTAGYRFEGKGNSQK